MLNTTYDSAQSFDRACDALELKELEHSRHVLDRYLYEEIAMCDCYVLGPLSYNALLLRHHQTDGE